MSGPEGFGNSAMMETNTNSPMARAQDIANTLHNIGKEILKKYVIVMTRSNLFRSTNSFSHRIASWQHTYTSQGPNRCRSDA